MSTTTRVAWFHCFAGIAGDMALASLLDAGADFDAVHELLSRLPIKGWSIEPQAVLRGGIAATHLHVDAPGDGVVRTLPAIREVLDGARLPGRVHDRSLAVFHALADAEGRLHRRQRDEVHFHELAAYDTLLDVVGVAAALEVLEIEDVVASAVATGTGTVRTEHGELPNPTPALLELLRNAPIYARDVRLELTTPTGAALLAALCSSYGPMPAMVLERTGYGAGTKELDGMPNCTQVVVGTRQDATKHDEAGQPLVLLETNLDDATGEQIADALRALFEAGAADAWVTPVLMKKGRPGHVVSALCDVARLGRLREVLLEETGSFGARSSAVERWASARRGEVVEVLGHEIRIKVRAGRAKVEHDDARHVAKATGRTMAEVLERATEEARKKGLISRS